MSLIKIVDVDEKKCVNCHRCISVCPVKFCNDGSGEHVNIDPNLCIGCGECIKACTHHARTLVDDFSRVMHELRNGTRMIAIVAPSVAANFPYRYYNLNGWLHSIGVEAFFDVSFGAELTVKSYIEYIKKNNPKCMIAQPCPAIVTYIQLYRPELIPYLAHVDSPMLHTCKMIREFYPEYRFHKIIAISPCAAKKREFIETGMCDYNVAMANIVEYLEQNRIDLSNYPEIGYETPPAERAVLFSSPGGLLQTALREVPTMGGVTRKIEGPQVIYKYLDQLHEQIEKGNAPLLVDCLNCELGCNGGTGTHLQHKSPDEVEALVEERRKEMQEHYQQSVIFNKQKASLHKIHENIDRLWRADLYERKYQDIHYLKTGKIRIPTKSQLESIYRSMHKTQEKDFKNCSSCGYNSCEMMAVAIFNGLNRPENCHEFLSDVVKEKSKMVISSADHAKKLAESAQKSAEKAGVLAEEMNKSISVVKESSHSTASIVKTIDEIASQTKIVALNATIEAARAGVAGNCFEVVAKEVKNLAQKVSESAKDIASLIQTTTKKNEDSIATAQKTMESLQEISNIAHQINALFHEIASKGNM